MTSFDALVDARSKQISAMVSGTHVRRAPEVGRGQRVNTWGEAALQTLGMPEEILTKAIGSVLTNNPRFKFGQPSSYDSQVGFADLLRETGMPSDIAAILGVGAAIANPLDPLNKLKILGLTKKGIAAERIAALGGKLDKVGDAYQVSAKAILEEIAAKKKALAQGNVAAANIVHAEKSIEELTKQADHIGELNEMLAELQRRGATLEGLKLGASTYEQVKLGQRHLLGFSSPMKMDQLSLLGFGRGATDHASVYGLHPKAGAALIKSISGVKDFIAKPIGDAAYKLAEYAGIPIIGRSELAKKTSSSIKSILDNSKARTEAVERDLLSIYQRHLDEGGTKEDLLTVLQAMEQRHSGVKEMAIDVLAKFNGVPAGTLITPDPEKYYRGFQTNEDLDGLRHMDKGRIWNDIFVIEMTSNINATQTGANNTYRAKIDPNKVTRIFYDVDSYDRRPVEEIKKIRARYPKAEFIDVKLNDAQDGFVAVGEYAGNTVRSGKGVDISSGIGLTDEQKLKLSLSGVDDAEIPVAVGQFQTASTPSVLLGSGKQFETKILGKYVVAKTTSVVSDEQLKELDGIFGQRVWAKHEVDGESYLIQKRHPSASRINHVSDFEQTHLNNLERIAAQLSNKKRGFVGLTPNDILVSPSGAVQIINPSVIAEFKSQKDAVANSLIAVDALAESLSIPKGSSREFQFLKSPKAAKRVPLGVDGLTFRSPNAVGDVGSEVFNMNAHDLLEQAANTEGYKDVVRASYDQISPQQLAELVGDPRDFERANNIEFHRARIRDAVAKGETPNIEPVAVVVDDKKVLHVVNGRDRLTAAILEGYEAIPVYKRNFVGDVIEVEKGFYSGKTARLRDLWTSADSSASDLTAATNGLVAPNYSVINRAGEVTKLDAALLALPGELNAILTRITTLGLVGKARTARVQGVEKLLTQNFGSVRNGLIKLAEIAETVADNPKAFVEQLEGMLSNAKTKSAIKLDNSLRHPDLPNLVGMMANQSTKALDNLAESGVLTNTMTKNARRIALASSSGDDVVVQILDTDTNTLRLFSRTAGTDHLKTVAESFINKTTTAADVEPYARIQLNGVDGTKNIEVKDLVVDGHPRLADVITPTTVFKISKDQRAALAKAGIYVSDKDTAASVRKALEEKGMTLGTLLAHKEKQVRALTTGKLTGAKETVIVRPEYAFFVTRSGSVVVGTKTKDVKDLLETVFEEGPAYFEEFGIMTTGKVIVSNPFGSKMEKIGIGEVRNLEDRLRSLATRFKELGLSDGTVLDVHVPFDNAVWRAMYGERVTIGDVLDSKFKLTIPDELRNHTPDIRLIAPSRTGMDFDVGVVAVEKTRLANKRLQELFTTLENYADETFLQEAKAGLNVSYYSSWFGRQATAAAKEALNEAWLKSVTKQSATFKDVESLFKGRLITDLTTQEFNEVIKRLQKAGYVEPEKIISNVVKEFRDGYMLSPNPKQAAALVALAKVVPEGLDFWHLDPIYAMQLSVRDAERAITRHEVVKSLEDMGVAVWSGNVAELNQIKTVKSPKYLQLEKEAKQLDTLLADVNKQIVDVQNLSPDVRGIKEAALKQQADELVVKLANKHAEKALFIEKHGTGKVLDTMVDLESEQVWLSGADATKLAQQGLLDPNDFVGDISDAFIRVPIKKYTSVLDKSDTKVFLFPKEVASVVQRYFGATTKEGFGKFLAMWDTVHTLWRNWTLFPIPSYHLRNGISSAFMAWLGGVTDPEVYKKSWSILKIIDGHRSGSLSKKQVQEALGAITFASATGEVMSGQKVFDEFVKHGGFAGGLHFNEFTAFGSIARASEFERLSIKAGLRPSSELAGSWLFDNSALRLGVSATAFVENRFRLAAFVDALVKGSVEVRDGTVLAGFEAAAMSMKKIFYDYSDLSMFERSWLRRVIPFYAWSRHNIPRMLSTMITDPIKHYRLAQFFHEVEMGATEGAPVGENDLPEWIRNRFGIVVNKTEKGNYVVKTGDGFLPWIDVYKVFAGSGISQMIVDGITPFVKVPIEQLTNYSTYTGGKIENVPGERSSSFTLGSLGFSKRSTTQGPLGILNILLNDSLLKTFFRPGGEFSSKVVDAIFDPQVVGGETPGLKLALYGLALGKAYLIDPNQARAGIFRNWHSRQNQLLGLRNDALQSGDMKTVEDTDNMLAWLRLQYPGDKE